MKLLYLSTTFSLCIIYKYLKNMRYIYIKKNHHKVKLLKNFLLFHCKGNMPPSFPLTGNIFVHASDSLGQSFEDAQNSK